MKNFKLFLGLLVSVAVVAVWAAEERAARPMPTQAGPAPAGEEERKESAAEAFDPEAEAKKLVQWFATAGHPSFIADIAKEYIPVQWPPFDGNKLVMGDVYGTAQQVFISPDQRYMAVLFGDDDAQELLLVVYDMTNRTQLLAVPVKKGEYNFAEFIAHGPHATMVISTMFEVDEQISFELKLFDLKNLQKEPQVLNIIDGYDISPDGSHIVYKTQGEVTPKLYKFPSLKEEKLTFLSAGLGVAFSPNGQYVALTNQDNVEFYDIKNPQQSPIVVEGDDVKFLADGRSVAVRLLERNQTVFYSIPGFVPMPDVLDSATIIYSPNDHYIGVVRDMEDESQQITFYEKKDLAKVLKVLSLPATADRFFSPDGRHFMVVPDINGSEIQLYDMQHFENEPKVFQGHAPQFSPDGRFITFNYDWLQFYYEINNPDEPYVIIGVSAFNTFSPDGNYFIVPEDEGGVALWDLVKVHDRGKKHQEKVKRFARRLEGD